MFDMRAYGLTERESAILRLLAGGRTARQAASELFMDIGHIEAPLANIAAKLGVAGRIEAVDNARRQGLA